MPDSTDNSSERDAIERSAAAWVLGHENGLAPAQEKEFAQWLAADPRHAAAFAEHRRAWDRFEPLARTMAGSAPPRRQSRVAHYLFPALAAAAAAAVVGLARWRTSGAASSVAALPSLMAPCERRVLEDGSVVELNRGADVAVSYTPGERHVQLTRGEAHFTVAKNPARPFIVRAGNVEVRAVGTAFDVRFDPAAVEVLVTEGKVQVGKTAPASFLQAHPAPGSTLVSAGQATVVSLAQFAPPSQVATMSALEMEARLAWQPRLLEYDDATLASIVAEFNRHNLVHLVIADPVLGGLRLTASFRSDNMEGFVRLIESNYEIRAESRGEREIVLSRK